MSIPINNLHLGNLALMFPSNKISVVLSASEKYINLALSDDGIGFSISEKMNSGGAGLTNLQNRAVLINATLYVQSAPGNGSKTTIELGI